MKTSYLIVVALLLAGCSRPHAGPLAVAVRLIDSVPWTTEVGMDASGVLHRVAVDARGQTDTLPDILTALPPVLVGDSILYGFSYHEDELRGAFRYDVRSRALTAIQTPPDLGQAPPALSPTGTQLAYWSIPGDGTATLVVRSWPAGGEIYRGAAVTIPATDVLFTDVRWADAAALKWLIEIPGDRALVGTWSPSGGWLPTDTVPISVSR